MKGRGLDYAYEHGMEECNIGAASADLCSDTLRRPIVILPSLTN